jgi:hypothetical protein
LDFDFIKRLKSDYLTIQEYIDKDSNFIVGQGIMVGGGDENNVSYLVGKRYIDTKTDIRQFWINPYNCKKWKYSIVHRPRNRKLFKAPMLLITGGNDNKLRCISAVNQVNAVFRSSLTAIKFDNLDILRNIAAMLNSCFFSYYNLQLFSSTGIEREETHDEEKLNIPFFKDNKISNIVKNIEELLIKEHHPSNEIINNQQFIDEKYIALDNTIFNAFSITKEEKCLIDYATNIIIPIQMQHENNDKLFQPIQLNDTILTDYANLFIERFKSSFVSAYKKFIVEIWYTQQIIGMFFKVIPEKEYTQDIILINKQNDESGILQIIATLSSEKITDKLFIHKDIRGFEKDCFFIFKPNEKYLWHKAVGYFDVYEFLDAILITGKNKK